MVEDLTLKQKEQILIAYTEYLKAKVELGIKPTEEEIQLLLDGGNHFMTDLKGTFRQVLGTLNEAFSHRRSTVKQIFPEMVENGGDEE